MAKYDIDFVLDNVSRVETIAKLAKLRMTWSQEQIDQVFAQVSAEYEAKNEMHDLLYQYWEDIRNDPNFSPTDWQRVLATVAGYSMDIPETLGDFLAEFTGAVYQQLQRQFPVETDPEPLAPEGKGDLTPGSPLILDLDGDGVETISEDAGVQFDLDNNGFAETIGWVAADDGLLALDKNNNGSIDNGNELFGNNTTLGSGGTATNGFAA